MNKLRFIITHCLLIFHFSYYSQSLKTKVVADSKTKIPIEYVYANSDTRKITAVSDRSGKIDLVRDPGIKSYTFYKIGYEKKTILSVDLFHADTIFLIEKPYELNEVEITTKELEEVIVDKTFYLDDYIVLPNADFLIITSLINIKGFEVSYYKRDRGRTCSKRFKNEFHERLFRDCFKNYQLVTHLYSRQFIFPTDSTFDFLPSYSRYQFDSRLAWIALNVDSHFIAKTSDPPESFSTEYYRTYGYSPFLTYKLLYKGTRSDFYSVVYSKEMREMIQSEIDDYYKRNGGTQHEINKEARNSFFFGKIVKPLYAPVFLKNDTVVLFNFQEDQIIYLNKFGHILGKVQIEKFSKYHDFEAFYDEVKQRFYIKFTEQDKHFLREINVYTGKLEKTIPLKWPFPRRIQIMNNKLYYMIREHDWDDTQYLFLQNI